jgi:hypothetical protein
VLAPPRLHMTLAAAGLLLQPQAPGFKPPGPPASGNSAAEQCWAQLSSLPPGVCYAQQGACSSRAMWLGGIARVSPSWLLLLLLCRQSSVPVTNVAAAAIKLCCLV